MEKKSRAIDVWGEELLSEGFSMIPNFLIRNRSHLDITHSEWQLLELLMTFKRDDSDPFPSQATLSFYLGISERQIRNLICSLKNKGLLETYRLPNGCSLAYNFDGLMSRALELHQNNSFVIAPNETHNDGETELPAESLLPVEGSVPPNRSTSTLEIFKKSTTTSIQEKNRVTLPQGDEDLTVPSVRPQEPNSTLANTDNNTLDPFTLIERKMKTNAPHKRLRLKERDNIAIKKLLQSDVPLEFILSTIDQIYIERPYTTISSFTYLEPIMIERWAKEVAKLTPVDVIDFKESHNRPRCHQHDQRNRNSWDKNEADKSLNRSMDSPQSQDRQGSGRIYVGNAKKQRDPRYSAFYELFPDA